PGVRESGRLYPRGTPPARNARILTLKALGIYSPLRMNNMTALMTVGALTSLDHTLAALADPTRRAILQRLTRGEARVTELAEPFPISLNSVSKHIRMLERADLVRRRRSG